MLCKQKLLHCWAALNTAPSDRAQSASAHFPPQMLVRRRKARRSLWPGGLEAGRWVRECRGISQRHTYPVPSSASVTTRAREPGPLFTTGRGAQAGSGARADPSSRPSPALLSTPLAPPRWVRGQGTPLPRFTNQRPERHPWRRGLWSAANERRSPWRRLARPLPE